MKTFFLIFALFLLAIGVSFGGDFVDSNHLVLPKTVNFLDEENYKNLQWNRYTTKNFTIISIDNNEGKWLSNNLDGIKEKCINRWGITNSELSAECRIMVVNNKELFKKFFNLSDSRVEFRKKDNKTDIIGVWLCIENHNHEDLEKVISQICFQDILNKKGLNKKFLEEGISLLAQNPQSIKELLKNVSADISIINKTDDEYKKLPEEDKRNFQVNSAAICLMLKKEFGEKNFLKLMFFKDSDNISQILSVYNYKDKDELEKTFKRYCSDLKKCIEKNQINDRYLKAERSLR